MNKISTWLAIVASTMVGFGAVSCGKEKMEGYMGAEVEFLENGFRIRKDSNTRLNYSEVDLGKYGVVGQVRVCLGNDLYLFDEFDTAEPSELIPLTVNSISYEDSWYHRQDGPEKRFTKADAIYRDVVNNLNAVEIYQYWKAGQRTYDVDPVLDKYLKDHNIKR